MRLARRPPATNATYTITVAVDDGQFSDELTMPIGIYVPQDATGTNATQPVTANRPPAFVERTFEFEVEESSATSRLIGRVNASDDLSDAADIVYLVQPEDMNELFWVANGVSTRVMRVCGKECSHRADGLLVLA